MARRRPAQVHGCLVVDKPAGITSHDVVDRARRALGERKVGHAGTLDPDATGVLVLGVGDATRLLRFIDLVPVPGREPTTSKSYVGTVVLGVETDSLDASGSVTTVHDMSAVVATLDVATVQRVVDEHLTGDILQVPPMVSALRVDGRRLHEMARDGTEVEREPRPVTVHSFRVVAVRGDSIDVDVSCSSGTYIRSLAADLGRLLGGGAHLRDLRRTRVGVFGLERAVSLEGIGVDSLLPVATAVESLSRLTVIDDEVSRLSTGGLIARERFVGAPPWAVFETTGRLLAVYEPFANERVGDGWARPAVNLVKST